MTDQSIEDAKAWLESDEGKKVLHEALHDLQLMKFKLFQHSQVPTSVIHEPFVPLLAKFAQLREARQSSQSEPVGYVKYERCALNTKDEDGKVRMIPHAYLTDRQLPDATLLYAAPQQAIPSGWKFTDAEVLEWDKRNDDKFQGKVHEARTAIEDARSMHLLSASPTAPIESDK
jgi:hypothetical protein